MAPAAVYDQYVGRPSCPQNYNARYAEVAAANFTAVLGGFGATTPAAVEAPLKAAEGAGLGVVNGYYRVASATEDGRTHYIKLCNDARAVNDPASDDDGDGNGLGNNSSAGATALVEIVYGRH